jgi:NTP pyrophosphatase (non-canonical NTP hydrolase)
MPNLSLEQLTGMVMKIAEDKKFGVKPEEINMLEKFALIHSEVSEAMEAYRRKNMEGKDGFSEELADAVIRIMHLAGIHKIDLEKEILKKLASNQDREWPWKKYNETHS